MLPRRLSSGFQATPTGALRQLLEIVSPSATQDALGGLTKDYRPFATVWGFIQDLQGKELYAAQQIVDQVTHKIVVRYLPGLRSNMMVRYQGRIFHIQAVLNPDSVNAENHLLCIERNDGHSGGQ